MLKQCAQPGCNTLTLGGYCLEHERSEDVKPPRLLNATVLTAIATVQAAWLVALAGGVYWLVA